MTPQSHFMVVAAIAPGREAALRNFLATMTGAPGMADPQNAVLPFGALPTLHFARLVILDTGTLSDLTLHGVAPPRLPLSMAFMGDCDGPSRDLMVEMVRVAEPGLRRLFAHCEAFTDHDDVLAWMRDHDRPLAASYVNWIGRTVQQVREESALQRALAARVPRGPTQEQGAAQALRSELVAFVRAEQRAGRLALTPEARTPPAWKSANLRHLVLVPLVGLLLLPLLIVLAPLFAFVLRRHETRDPEIAPRPAPAAMQKLQRLEDHDVTNQFTAIGAVKPGRFRLWTLIVLLTLLDYSCRHVYHRGHLTRVQTIHFARWAFLDGKTRLIFASNYDGSLESYMDDFINKVGWGLNVVFSNGVGYPRTDWLLKGGSRREQAFKYYLRRHELPTEVWYKAYPGLTAVQLDHNHRIRVGLERESVSDGEAAEWLQLL